MSDFKTRVDSFVAAGIDTGAARLMHDMLQELEAAEKREGELVEALAELRVLRIRGSYDAPGFDSCVKAEIDNLTNHKKAKES